ncbi:unnamed protein product [Dicrocoelium dendriticum]|nr:unnamed protein product [Dicrocoelium dendriticum]
MHRHALDAITSLLPQTQSATLIISQELALCIQNYICAIGTDSNLVAQISGKEVYEAFCLCCMDYLYKCANAEVGPDEPLDAVFSITREAQLRRCMEFLICLGAYPLLDAGVSLPLEMRLESSPYYQCPKNLSDPNRRDKLLQIGRCLLQLRGSKLEQLKRLISPNLFLGDLIAVLAQAAYGPVNSVPSSDLPTIDNPCTQSRKLLWTLLTDLPGDVAMKELLILQGGTSGTSQNKGAVRLPTAPAWLRRACGRLLSRLLVRSRDSGSESVESGVLDLILASASLSPGLTSCSPSSCITSLDPRLQPALVHALASIISSSPATLPNRLSSATVEPSESHYHQFISKQVLALIEPHHPLTASHNKPDGLFAFGRLVALATVHVFCSRRPTLGIQFYLQPLIGVLDRFVIHGEDSSAIVWQVDGIPDTTHLCELANAKKLSHLLTTIRDLLSVPTPSVTVINELLKRSQPLFRLLIQVLIDDERKTNELPSSPCLLPSPVDLGNAKTLLLSVLSRLLTLASEAAYTPLFVLRSWLSLPTAPPFGVSDENKSSTPQSVVIFPPHPHLAFRIRSPILSSDGDDDTLSPDQTPVPYRAVIQVEPVCDVQLQSGCMRSAIELLRFLNPDQHSQDAPALNDEPPPALGTAALDVGNSDSDTSGIRTLTADLFLSLIADLNKSLDTLSKPEISTGVQLLPSVTDKERSGESAKAYFLSPLLASVMLSELGDQIWPKNPAQVAELLDMTLQRLSFVVSHSDEIDLLNLVAESIDQILGIVAFYLQQIGPPSTDLCLISARDAFARLLPTIDQLNEALKQNPMVTNDAQLELLHCLRVMLATRGAVDPTKTHPHSTCDSTNHRTSDPLTLHETSGSTNLFSHSTRSLIQEVTPVTDSVEPQHELHSEPAHPRLQEALDQLKDPLIPMRGHALITISRMVESRDSCIPGQEERIFRALVHHLSESDSYIYLNAIRGLSALGLTHTDRVIQVLLERFRQLCIAKPQRADNRIEFQLKLGEAIMRILRQLGQMAPKYLTPVLNTMALGARCPEPLIRAASLSNLADFVRLLRYATAPIIYDIFALIELHLAQDPSPSVRSAAANLARSLFLEDTIPDWLNQDVLRDLNRLLSARSKVEKDEQVLEQVEAALGELDKCVRSSLFSKTLSPEQLVKEIRVLRPF